MMTSLRDLLLVTTAFTAASFPSMLLAQSAGQPEVIEDITVTARKRSEKLREVPFTVDAQTRKQLEEKGVTDGPSALRDVTGAAAPTFGDRSSSFLTMRGVGPVLFPLSPDDSSVLTFIDGAPQGISSSFGPYLDLQRVEVMKGPQSVLFGRNTSGGAINLIPVLPSQTPEGYARIEYGTANQRKLEGAFGGPIVQDKVAGRFAFRMTGADGHINNTFGAKLGREDGYVGRGSLLFTPTDRTNWLVTLSGEKNNLVPAYYVLKGDGWPILAGQNLYKDNGETLNFTSKFEHAFDTFNLTSLTAYHRKTSNFEYNADFHLMSRVTGLPPVALSNPNTNYFRREINDSRFTQEIRFNSQDGAKIPWLIGAAYYRDQGQWDSSRNVFLYGPFAAGRDTYNLTTQGKALFGELTYPVFETLKFSLGGRYTHENKDFKGEYFTDGTPGTVPYFREDGKKDYSFWTGRAALSYDWNPGLITYGSIARGYKSGGYGSFNQAMALGVARKPYDSATIISYELGTRLNFLDNRLKVNAALFYNDMKKEQILGFDAMTFNTVSLNVDARSYGGELDASYKLDTHWEVGAGAGYTFSEMRNVSAALAAVQPGMKSGNRLPLVPEWTGRAAVSYRASLEELGLGNRLGNANLLGRMSYNLTGFRFGEAANVAKLDPMHIVSARLGLEWEKGEAYIFGDNLLNKRNTVFAQPYGTSVVTGNTVYGATYSRGVTAGLGATVRY
jgi:iron complex outermembrane receptor protein